MSGVALCRWGERGGKPAVHITGSHAQARECEGIVKRLVAGDYYGMGFLKQRVPIRPLAALRKLANVMQSASQVEALGEVTGCSLEPEELLDDDQPCVVIAGPPEAVDAATIRAVQ